ncbi:MAG TPA: heme-copper oxidase subunit III [Candidatus Dormibacteraeota bacterium]|jgi:cytochrome c oxidase subunit 3|nr:heme-copper oxidase subunit III [Candidatus Dormibacteraeota bacterium]
MAVAAPVRPVSQHELPMVTGMMGMFIFLGSEVMFFGSLFAAYFYVHLSHATWPPPGTFAVEWQPIPAINTIILLSSGVTMHIGHHAIQKGQRQKLVFWLIVTIVLGALFEVGQGVEFARAYGVSVPLLGSAPAIHLDTNVFASTFFAMTGFHGIHVLGGLCFLLLVLWRTAKGHFDERHHVAVAACAIYWHFVDLVWIFLFGILYLAVTAVH